MLVECKWASKPVGSDISPLYIIWPHGADLLVSIVVIPKQLSIPAHAGRVAGELITPGLSARLQAYGDQGAVFIARIPQL